MVKHLAKESEFDELIKTRVLVDFYADWCGPCQRLAPLLESVKGIDILKVNVDEYPEIAKNYGIMSIPTLILFKDGKEVRKEIGFHTVDEITEMIK